MKQNRKRLLQSGMLAATAICASAQTAELTTADTLATADSEMVNVAFRKVAKADLLGGVSTINMPELLKKNYNTYSLDNLQGYVGGWNGSSLWGENQFIVLVDGVERDVDNVVPSEIDQITFLKGAQAVVLYGSRASKGAILITTKRGKKDGLNVDVRANTGWDFAKSFPEYLGSAEYMTYYNQARTNDGLEALYSEADIYNHGSGLNPYRYPNVDYYSSDYIKKSRNRSEATVELEGGGRRAHFYGNIGYIRIGDYFKFGEAKDNYTSRFNVRGNVDVIISNKVKAFVNANATFYDANSAIGNYWSNAATARPNRPTNAAALIPLSMIDPNAQGALDLISTSGHIIDGHFLAGNSVDKTNIIADYYAAGNSTYTSRQFQFDTGVNIDLNGILKGLTFDARFAVDFASSYTTSFNDTYAVYTPTWSNYGGKDVIVDLKQEGTDEHSGVQNMSNSTFRRNIAWSGQFNYNRTFNGVHNLSAVLLANMSQITRSGEYHRTTNANLGLQADYNYARKYYATVGLAGIHSAKLAEGNREALSPSFSLGWRLKNEGFLKNSKTVSDLMLSASYSVVNEDVDISDYYLYEGTWSTAYGYSWYDGGANKYTVSTRGNNPDLGFVKRKEFSINLRGGLFDNMITFDASYFVNNTTGLLVTSPTYYPSYMSIGYPASSFIPVVNYNENRRNGFDFAIKGQKKFGNVDLALGLTGTYYNTKATKRDETVEYDYLKSEGQPLDGIWGYQSMGLFQSQEEIDEAPTQNLGSTVKPGDIRYVDQNNDGVIDTKDRVYLGKGGWYGSPFTLGVNFTAKYKDFTFFMLCNGYFGGYGVKNNSYWWVSGDSKYSAVVRDAWTEENAENATYPRLSTTSASNNFQTSDYWMYSTDRFNISKIQVTYDMPKAWFASTFIKDLSVYVSGSNLLTISKNKDLLEMNVGSAPQTRFYNIGAKLSF